MTDLIDRQENDLIVVKQARRAMKNATRRILDEIECNIWGRAKEGSTRTTHAFYKNTYEPIISYVIDSLRERGFAVERYDLETNGRECVINIEWLTGGEDDEA